MLGVSPRPLPGVSASSENKQRAGASEQRAHNLVGSHMPDFCVFDPTAQSARARLGSAATLTIRCLVSLLIKTLDVWRPLFLSRLHV